MALLWILVGKDEEVEDEEEGNSLFSGVGERERERER
jgi:F0F1-type ATP synthase beta subunit